MVKQQKLPEPLISIYSPGVTLDTVGGKGVNLSKLALAGFPVPDGYIIPTSCYWDYLQQNDLALKIQTAIRGIDPTSMEVLETVSGEIRSLFQRDKIPDKLESSLRIVCELFPGTAVAVRSSATSEDLPDLSFAGQQDTYLNILGENNILDAIVRCWSSLWTARAIGYRSRNNIPQDGVALAVIVQKMVMSDSSGVMFTANPLTGTRSESVVDVTLGLGEALVGGQVEPDHFVVDTRNMEITKKYIGSKSSVTRPVEGGGVITVDTDPSRQQAVPDEVLIKLVKTGIEIEVLFGSPQDIEWAYQFPSQEQRSSVGKLFILQSRPITSLYPLPNRLKPYPLKFLVGFHAVQGILEPITPLGQDLLKLLAASGGRIFGIETSLKTQTAFYSAGERLWVNFTPIILSPIGYKVFPKAIKAIDPGVALILNRLIADSKFQPNSKRPNPISFLRAVRYVLPLFKQVLRSLRHPDRNRELVQEAFNNKVQESLASLNPTGALWHDFANRISLLMEAENIFPDLALPLGIPLVVAGLSQFFFFLERFSKELVETTGDPQYGTLHMEIARGLPHNVTTEMDLFLWKTAQMIKTDPTANVLFVNSSPEALSKAYLTGDMHPSTLAAVGSFLSQYGIRCLGEIDIGRPRWVEDPTHVMGVLQSYLKISDPSNAPDVVFTRGKEAAVEAADKFISAVSQLKGGWLKAHLAKFAVGRYRALAGMREAPKFFAVRMMGIIHQELVKSGNEFVNAGLISDPYDLFFLTTEELNLALEGKNFPDEFLERITERRQIRERELKRANLPRVMLSDGTVFFEGISTADSDQEEIIGDPVSPGTVEGRVRIVFDPIKTQLEPGEILVCLGTDPAWTPLFLAAGGLVMEVGGMMTHGSVVAREYGIPAVVGVNQATKRLKTGQRIKLDGSSGRIALLD